MTNDQPDRRGPNDDVLKRQAAAMEAAGLDAMVAVSPENFAYVAGIVVPSQPWLRWRHAAIVTCLDGRAAALCVDMEETTVRAGLPGIEVRVWAEFEDDAMPILAGLLRDLGLGSARVGIETDYLPARDMEALRGLLPSARWEEAQRLFNRLRMIKTPREVDLIRRVSRATDRAIQAAFSSVRAGDTEIDLAGAATTAIYREGAEQFKLLVVASGERSQYPNVGPTGRVLRAGDLVRLEVFGMLSGFHAGVCRTAVVGGATEEAGRIWDNLAECRRIVFDSIGPGASSAEVYSRFLARFGLLGYEPISFVGHGIGFHLHEEPYLGRYGDWRLEPGMVLGVEPLLYLPGRFGLQLKDMVLVSERGCELLSDASDADRLSVIP